MQVSSGMEFLEVINRLSKQLHGLTAQDMTSQCGELAEETEALKNADTNERVLLLLSKFYKTESNMRKQFCKVMKKWLCRNSSSFERAFEEHLLTQFSVSSVITLDLVNTIYVVICEFKEIRKKIRDFLPSVLRSIAQTLCQLQKLGEYTSNLYVMLTKLNIQILQIYKEVLVEKLSAHDNADEFIPSLQLISSTNLHVIFAAEPSCPGLRQLCATVIGYLISCHNVRRQLNVFMNLLDNSHTSLGQIEIMPNVFVDLTFPADSHKNPAVIWLIRGFLCCCPGAMLPTKNEVKNLFQSTGENNPSASSLIYQLILQVCRSNVSVQYHGFYALNLWWKSVFMAVSSEARKYEIHDRCYLVSSSLTVVWDNWDSQVSGATDILMSIFSYLLDVLRIAADNEIFITTLSEQLLSVSNSVKGKYWPLAVMIEKFGADAMLERRPNLIYVLLDGLATNHLAAAVSKVYRTLVHSLFSDKDNFDVIVWKSTLGGSLVDALLRPSSQIRQNALHYWLPVNLQLHSSVFPTLTEILIDRKSERDAMKVNSAMIGVIKTARSAGLVSFCDLNFNIVEKGIIAFDNETRKNSFWVICKNQRKSEFISIHEFEFLYRHLPSNMNSDCAAFRHDLCFCLRLFLTRIQCSVIAAEKQKEAMMEYTSQCLNFLCWLHQLCISSLNKSSSFQRKITALNIYESILCSFCDVGNAQHKDAKLLQEAFQRHDIDLASAGNIPHLIALFHDVVSDVRQSTSKILTSYFPLDKLFSYKALIKEKYSRLLNSPKVQDAECGALLLEFMIKLYALKSAKDILHHSIPVLRELLQNMREHYRQYLISMLEASINHPMFGWSLALAQSLNSLLNCLTDVKKVDLQDEMFHILMEIIEDVIDVIHFFLTRVFSCISPEDKTIYAASADFEEMSRRLDEIIAACKSPQGGSKEQIQLSRDQEVLLSSCWLSLKNSCFLLSTACRFLVKSNFFYTENSVDRISSQLHDVCSAFVTVLSMCRYRGVIESSRDSFVSLLVCLFESERFVCIPNSLLHSVLEAQQRKEIPVKAVTGGTITRRSAGLPLIVDAILSASVLSRSSMSDVFSGTMLTLLESLAHLNKLNSMPQAGVIDCPQVDALFILKNIFQSNVLGPHITSYLTTAFTFCLSCLSSPIWVVRNAAIHLLGVLSSRMLGQKHVEVVDDSGAFSLTASEFFARFPDLLPYSRELLQNWKKSQSLSLKDNDGSFTSSLNLQIFPVLSLLSKLAFDVRVKHLQPQVLVGLLSSRLSSIRRKAAKLLLSICFATEIDLMLTDYFQSLPDDQQTHNGRLGCIVNQNELHGWLMLALEYCKRNNGAGLSSCNWEHLLHVSWVSRLTTNPCPLTAALYLQLLAWKVKEMGCCDATITLHYDELISTIMDSTVHSKKIGYCDYTEALLGLLLLVSTDQCLSWLIDTCVQNHFKREELAMICFQFLEDNVSSSIKLCENSTRILSSFWKAGFKQPNSLERPALKLFIKMQNYFIENATSLHEEFRMFCNHVFKSYELTRCLSVRCLLIKSMAVLVTVSLHSEAAEETLQRWLSVLKSNTWKEKVSEPLRQSASESLNMSGGAVMRWLSRKYSESKDLDVFVEAASSLCAISLLLLHDEQSEVRDPVCRFVASLMEEDDIESLQQNIASKALLSYLLAKFSPHQATLSILLSFYTDVNLPKSECSNSEMSLFEQEAFNLYYEAEHFVMLIHPYLVELSMKLSRVEMTWLEEHLHICVKLLHELSEYTCRYGWQDVFGYGVCTLCYVELIMNVAKKHYQDILKVSINLVSDLLHSLQVSCPEAIKKLIADSKKAEELFNQSMLLKTHSS